MWSELLVGAIIDVFNTAVKTWLVTRLRVDVVLGNLSRVTVGDVKLTGVSKGLEDDELKEYIKGLVEYYQPAAEDEEEDEQ